MSDKDHPGRDGGVSVFCCDFSTVLISAIRKNGVGRPTAWVFADADGELAGLCRRKR